MFVKIAIVIALILGTASEVLAAPKQKHTTNRTYVYNAHGQHEAAAGVHNRLSSPSDCARANSFGELWVHGVM